MRISSGLVHVARALVDRQAERLPDLLGLEAVAQQVAALDRELLALVALLLRELRVVVAQREAPEGDVARLVLHDVGVDRRRRAGSATGRGSARTTASASALDQHLHAEVGDVPARVGQRSLEQASAGRRDRVGELELLVQQPRVRLDVARLVDHLGRGVELGVDVRHLLHDLGGADQRALLAVHELRELPGLEVAAHLRVLGRVMRFQTLRAEDRDRSRRAAARGSRDRGPATSRCAPPRSTAGCLPFS